MIKIKFDEPAFMFYCRLLIDIMKRVFLNYLHFVFRIYTSNIFLCKRLFLRVLDAKEVLPILISESLYTYYGQDYLVIQYTGQLYS